MDTDIKLEELTIIATVEPCSIGRRGKTGSNQHFIILNDCVYPKEFWGLASACDAANNYREFMDWCREKIDQEEAQMKANSQALSDLETEANQEEQTSNA